MNRFIFAFVAVLLLASCDKKQKTSIETAVVERGELTETVTATGTIESVTQVDVGTQVTGIIDKLYVDYNSVVTKGSSLLKLKRHCFRAILRVPRLMWNRQE